MKRGFIGAACVVLACGLAAATELPAALDYAPAPASALVARKDVPFVIASAVQDQKEFTMLAHRQDAGPPKALAWLAATGQNSQRQIMVKSVAAPGSRAILI